MTDFAKPERQVPGVYHLTVGDVLVTALNDGVLEGSFDWLAGIPSADAEALHHARFRPVPPRITVNAFLLHLHGKLVLVDAGCGGSMGSDTGRLAASLAAMGVVPGSVDAILSTHLHPDHVGGLLDSAGRAVFPNAELIVHAAEPRFWGDDAILAKASDQEAQFAELARASMRAYGNRTREITDGEVLRGVTAVPEPGHTPGHTGWLISSGGDSLLIWGDIVHMPGVQFARPEAGMGFDVDTAQAIATRARIFDMAATDRLRVSGMHLDFPAFGHLTRDGAGYAFVPEVWSPGV